MIERKGLYLLVSLLILLASHDLFQAQDLARTEPTIQLCGEYSSSGDLLKASVSLHSVNISIARRTGQVINLIDRFPDVASISKSPTSIIPCQIAVSSSSDRAALAIPTASDIVLELIDLTAGKLTHRVHVQQRFPIQFSLHPIGFIQDSGQLAVSQAHYLPTAEPEIATELVNPDGSITSVLRNVTGPRYSEVSASSFDFRDARVWFLCPAYSARIDRQPRCTLASASLLNASAPLRDIPPPPNDRVVGSGQPNLGFPSEDFVVLLAEGRFWLFSFADRSFRQLNIPETPHHIRWFEFPGQPKFSSDGRFAAVPVYMFHAPLFEEGQVSHGTKLLVIEMPALHIVETIQPTDKQNLVDFALHSDEKGLSIEANWGNEWRTFEIPYANRSSK